MHSYADPNNNNNNNSADHLNGGGEQQINGSSRYFSFNRQTNGSSGDASIDDVFSTSGTATGSTSTLISSEPTVEQLLSGAHSSMDGLQQKTSPQTMMSSNNCGNSPEHISARNEYLLHNEHESNNSQLSPLQTEKMSCESPKSIKSSNLPSIDFFS